MLYGLGRAVKRFIFIEIAILSIKFSIVSPKESLHNKTQNKEPYEMLFGGGGGQGEKGEAGKNKMKRFFWKALKPCERLRSSLR